MFGLGIAELTVVLFFILSGFSVSAFFIYLVYRLVKAFGKML